MKVDIVIPWVDGADPILIEKRRRFLPNAMNAKNSSERIELSSPLRWENNDELKICLWSIYNFAEWVNRIHIITDGQTPPDYGLPMEFLKKIIIHDHDDVFGNYKSLLPNFNSASIETAAINIPDVAKHFLVFNDDFLFTRKTHITDFVTSEGKSILRGWFNGGALERGLMWSYHRLNGALYAGFDRANMFTQAHCCQLVDTDLVKSFLESYPDLFHMNLSHRIRHEEQFVIYSLSAHLCILNDRAQIAPQQDWIHIPASLCQNGSVEQIARLFSKLHLPQVRIGCVNDLRSANLKIDFAMNYLEELVGIN